MNAKIKTVDYSKYLKVLPDGSKVSAEDPRTDHLIVVNQELKLEFYVNSVGVNGQHARNADKELRPIVAQLDILGGGWRFPELDEATTIIRRDRYNPAVDQNLFPGIKPAWHITATPAAWAPARAAWWVIFNLGNVNVDYLFVAGFALAVRPAGQ